MVRNKTRKDKKEETYVQYVLPVACGGGIKYVVHVLES
jgi:uncharacterized protein YaaQ